MYQQKGKLNLFLTLKITFEQPSFSSLAPNIIILIMIEFQKNLHMYGSLNCVHTNNNKNNTK